MINLQSMERTYLNPREKNCIYDEFVRICCCFCLQKVISKTIDFIYDVLCWCLYILYSSQSQEKLSGIK